MKHFLLKLLCFATLMGCGNAWAETWKLCTISELSSNDIFVIVDANSGKAMTNNNGTSSAPAAASVTISQDGKTITEVTDVMKWNISGNGNDGYTIYPNGSTTTWLYATATNNGLRVGTNTNKTFVIENYTNDEPFLKHVGTSRFIGVYNSQDWRCYTSVNANINTTETRFYKYVNESDTRTEVNLTAFTTAGNATFIVKGGTLSTTVTNDQNGWTASYTYESSNKDVATVNESGVITAVSKGSARITVSLNIANNDANYKVGTTASKYVDITVNNPSHKAQFSVNGAINHEDDKDIEEGEPITFPNDPTSPAVPEGKVFMGWKKGGEEITTPQDEAITVVVKTSEKMGDNDVTYYAVFATKVENVKEYTFTIYPNDFNGKSYSANDGEHTVKSITTDEDEKDVMYKTSNVMLQSSKIQFKSSSGILYNTTDLGTIKSVSLTDKSNVTVYYGSSQKPTSSTTISGGYFSVKANSSLGSASSIIVCYSIDKPSYSDYCTTVNVVALASISIKTAPKKQTYLEGESFDPTGLVITAHYEDESDKVIEYDTNSSSFSYDNSALKKDDNSIAITYGGKSVNQPICVLPVNTIVLNFNEGWTVNDNIASGKDNNDKDVSIECEGSRDPFGLKGTPKYLAFNGRNATITLPAFDFPVSKIEVVGPSSEANPSKDIEQNIYVGETAVSTTTKGWGDNYVLSFDIDPKYQAPGLQYSLKIESDNSSHVTEIRIFKNEDYSFTISYVVNGVEIGTESLKENNSLTFPSNPADQSGKKFVGWVETPIDGVSSMAPAFVNTTGLKAADNKTYYAVFASLGMAPSNTFTRISANELTDGMTIAVTTYKGKSILNTSFDNSQLSNAEDNNKITVTEASQKWVVKAADGGWNICNGNNTIGFETAPTSDDRNQSASLTDNNNVWTIEEHTGSNNTVMIHNRTTYIDYYDSKWPVYYNDKGNRSTSVELRLYKAILEEGYSNYCTEFATLNFVATDGESYYATFSNPRNVVMPAEGISAYLVSVTNGKMVLTDLEKNCKKNGEYWNLPSNTGYLLKNTSNTSVVYTFVTESSGEVDPLLNMLVPCTTTGTFKAEADDNKYYKLAYGDNKNKTNLGFWWGADRGTGDFKVKAGGAILAVPQSAGASMLRGLSFDEAVSNETNVSKISYANSESSIIYNAQGIQVETIKENGLYVVNGKVIMIKK